MRRVVYSVACSLDGYIARLDHSVDWLPEDGDDSMTEFYGGIDTALIGRKTHDFMVKHGQPTMPGIANYVFSRNPLPKAYKGVQWVRENAVELVRELKAGTGKDIWLVGGSDLAQTFFHARLVDEISLAVVPILLGEGIPLFPKVSVETRLKLVGEKKCSNGMVRLTYACAV